MVLSKCYNNSDLICYTIFSLIYQYWGVWSIVDTGKAIAVAHVPVGFFFLVILLSND